MNMPRWFPPRHVLCFWAYTCTNPPCEKGEARVKDYIWKRVLEVSKYIASNNATVRQTAGVFQVSKSTVHKDVTERLPQINQTLFNQVKEVLEVNKAERHLRGGEATKKKYQSNLPYG